MPAKFFERSHSTSQKAVTPVFFVAVDELNKKLNEYPRESDLYQIGERILSAANDIIKKQTLTNSEIQKLCFSLELVGNMLDNLNNAKNAQAIIALETYAIHDVAEKYKHPSPWELYAGCLSMLAGVGIIQLANSTTQSGGKANLKPVFQHPSRKLFH